jgi:hypothetical protein
MSFRFRASDLDPAQRFLDNLLSLFSGIRVDKHLLLAGPSPWSISTRSSGRVF